MRKKKEVRSLYHKGYGPFYNLTIYLIIHIHTFFLKNVYICRPEKLNRLTRKNKFLNMRTADISPLSYSRVRELRQ